MQTAGLLKLSSKSLLSLEVIASGIWWRARGLRGAGSPACLSAAEGMGSASRWGADPELGFEPVEKVEQLGPSGSGLLGTGVEDAWV